MVLARVSHPRVALNAIPILAKYGVKAVFVDFEDADLVAAELNAAGIGIMMAMRYGLARGIYANEAGYGTAAVAYGTARSIFWRLLVGSFT